MTLFDMECHHECFFLRIGCLFVQSLFVRISGLHEIPLYNKTPSMVVLTPCTFPPVMYENKDNTSYHCNMIHLVVVR